MLVVDGKRYVSKEVYDKNPKEYDGHFDKPIPGMTRDAALYLIDQGSLHSFEDVKGEDLLDSVTVPTPNSPTDKK